MASIDTLLAAAGFTFGGIVMTAFSGSSLVDSKKGWWRFAVSVALIAVVIQAVAIVYYYGTPGYSILIRDVFASFVLAAGITFVIAAITRRLASSGTGPAIRVIFCSMLTLLFGVLAPFAIIMVHCTSNDCL
jgi:hypothetical protein